MTTQTEALKLALEALENLINQHYAETTTNDDLEKADNAITAIKEALAQPEQEPVALDVTIDDEEDLALLRDMVVQSNGDLTSIRLVVGSGHSGYGLYVESAEYPDEGSTLLVYTTPPQRPSRSDIKPLTDEQREEIAKGWRGRNWTVGDIIDATEAAHGIKGAV